MNGYILDSGATLRKAIGRINGLSGGVMTLFIINRDGRMIGTLTDGDVRRGLLSGLSLDAPAMEAANRSFKAIKGDICGDTVEILRGYREKGIVLVPRLDEQDKIVEIIDLRATPTRLPVSAILMAGGKGERLRPLTLDCPKPLLKIEDKAIIDYNIEALVAAGISDITVTTRYLAEKIEKHFEKPVGGVKVKCLREDFPLGTIGAVSLIDRPRDGSTIVMNSDLITSISFEEFFLKHFSTKADITIGVVPYQVSVPYAILSIEADKVVGLQEKPSYSYYANAGIYLFKNHILDTICRGEKIDATDLIKNVISGGAHVTYYPIKGTWIDVGSPTDFKQAAELLHHHRNLAKTK